MTTDVAPRRILIIDDDEWIRKVVAVALEAVAGWEVRVAESGPVGIALAANDAPDAILLDVMMPDMDGPETLAELRNRRATADLPVLLLTAKVQPSERKDLADLPVAGMIAKPFDPMTLAGRVEELLGWRNGESDG